MTLLAQAKEPLLVLDMRNMPTLPRKFRTSDHAPKNNIDWRGFADLHAAAGGQFSKLSLSKVLAKLNTKELTIIDLRQESHGFLNGNAISWYGPNNGSNATLTPEEVELKQAALLATLRQYEDVTVYNILKKSPNGNIEKTQATDYAVHQVSTEAEVVDSFHLKYYRIYNQDLHAPDDAQVDRFVDIVRTLPPNQWLFIHCRGGWGRSSAFMVMYDMMHNAKNVSYENIIARQAAIGGRDFSQMPPKNNTYKYKAALARQTLLKRFYEYARTNSDDFATSYTAWEKQHPAN